MFPEIAFIYCIVLLLHTIVCLCVILCCHGYIEPLPLRWKKGFSVVRQVKFATPITKRSFFSCQFPWTWLLTKVCVSRCACDEVCMRQGVHGFLDLLKNVYPKLLGFDILPSHPLPSYSISPPSLLQAYYVLHI